MQVVRRIAGGRAERPWPYPLPGIKSPDDGGKCDVLTRDPLGRKQRDLQALVARRKVRLGGKAPSENHLYLANAADREHTEYAVEHDIRPRLLPGLAGSPLFQG